MSKRKHREYSEEERDAARAFAELLVSTFSRLVDGHPVDARGLYDQMRIEQPYGFWLHRNIINRHGFDEGSEYVRDGKQVLLTNDAALQVAIGSPGLVGACLQVKVSRAMSDFVAQPGNEALRSMDGLMAEATRQFEDGQRLKRLMMG